MANDELNIQSGAAAAGEPNQEDLKQRADAAISEVIASGGDVKERVRSLVVELFRGRMTPKDSIQNAAAVVFETATDVVRRSVPENPEHVLRSVIDGVASGVESMAQATEYAVKEARGRGERFVAEDLDRVTKDLDTLRKMFLETVTHMTDRFTSESGVAARELKAHAARAFDSVQPVVTNSIEALKQNPVGTAAEAGNATVRGGRLLAGSLLEAVSGALAGAAEILKGEPEDKQSRVPRGE